MGLTIIVSGMIATDPCQGGATWAVLQYLLGFRELGHEVYFVEPIPLGALVPKISALGECDNATYFREVMSEFGLTEVSALLLANRRQTVGMPYEELCAVAKRADVLINISGMLTDPEILDPIRCRVYLDLDPAFIQMWQAVNDIDMRFGGHTHFVTIGQLIGSAGCGVPTCGREWLKTFQPIVLSRWPVAERDVPRTLTTIGNWRGYGSIEHEGVLYGQKVHSLRGFIGLPKETGATFELAMAIDAGETKDLAALAENGWKLVDPAKVAGSPAGYQRFIQQSWGEFGIAKSGYVVSRCGWFSDRSVCYLASGRPVIAQDTGFSEMLPVGEGLFAFTDAKGVGAAIEAMKADYPRHSRAARRIAEEVFDSKRVLSRLLEMVGVAG